MNPIPYIQQVALVSTYELHRFAVIGAQNAFTNYPLMMGMITLGAVFVACQNKSTPSAVKNSPSLAWSRFARKEPEGWAFNTVLKCLEGAAFACFIGAIAFSAPGVTLSGAAWALATKLLLPSIVAATVSDFCSETAQAVGKMSEARSKQIGYSIGAMAFNLCLACVCEATILPTMVLLAIDLVAASASLVTNSNADALGWVSRPIAPVSTVMEGVYNLSQNLSGASKG